MYTIAAFSVPEWLPAKSGAGLPVILTAQSHRPNAVFYQIIVNLKSAILQIDVNLIVSTDEVVESLSYFTLG